MLHNRVFPVDQRRKTVSAPDQPALVALFRSLKLEAQPRPLPFILHTIEAAPLTPESNVLCLAEANPIHSAVRTGCQGLRHHGIDMIGNPGTIGLFRKVV